MKLSKIIESQDSLKKFSNLNLKELNLGYPDVRKVMKLISFVDEEFKIFQKTINDLVKKYGKMNDEKKQIEIRIDSNEYIEYKKEYEELLNSEVDLKIGKIKMNLDPTAIEITFNDAIILENFFEWGENGK